jgi:hypothetical protein
MTKKRNIYLDSQGTRLPGVTTVLSVIDKSAALVPWASKMACESIRSVWKPATYYTQEDIDSHLATAKVAHAVRKNEAGDYGSNIHELCAAYIEGQILPHQVKDERERITLENFVKVTAGWEWLGSECTLIHDRLKFGGTADGLAKLPSGMIVVTDQKTSKSIYPEMFLQLCMYSMAEPNDERLRDNWKKIEEGRLLHLCQERNTWEIIEVDLKSNVQFIEPLMKIYSWKRANSQR